MDKADTIRDQAIGTINAAIAVLVTGRRKLGQRKPPRSGIACIGLLALACLWFSPFATVPTVNPPSATVAQPSLPQPTVDLRSDGAAYWISTARGNRAKLHAIGCRYHKMQTDSPGAAERRYYRTLATAFRNHPGCDCCAHCLEGQRQWMQQE